MKKTFSLLYLIWYVRMVSFPHLICQKLPAVSFLFSFTITHHHRGEASKIDNPDFEFTLDFMKMGKS